MSKSSTLAALAFLLTFTSQTTFARDLEEPRGTFGEEVSVSEVLLDVLVTDRDGNVIIGLQPDDFVVEENGKPISVTGLSFYSNRRLLDAPETTTASGTAIDTAPKNRYFILFFQEQQHFAAGAPELNLIQRQLKAANESRSWVQKEKLRDDYVAVLSYDVKLKVHQDFTQDSKAILKAIDGATTGKDPGANWPSRMPEEGTISLRTSLPVGNALAEESRTIYEALGTLAKATNGIVGRKNLIYFGIGFGDVEPLNGLYKPDPRYVPAMLQALNDNNVAVYTLDLMPNQFEYDLSDSLHELASETGGRYYSNFTSFLTPMKQVANENNGYYLLSYSATHPAGASGYQKVTIKAKNREFKVQAREGYLYGGT